MADATIWAPKGEPGNKGPDGDKGPVGDKGPIGDPGPAGPGTEDLTTPGDPTKGPGAIPYDPALPYVPGTVGAGLVDITDRVAELQNKNVVLFDTPTGGAVVPAGTAAQRPVAPVIGTVRFNTSIGAQETWNGTDWVVAAGTGPSAFLELPDAYLITSSLTKFGNMTAGGGLEGIFDLNPATAGYREATSGYAGVTLPAAKEILSFELTSGDSGFDGSGLVSAVTLAIYGKNGAAPASATDGTLLVTESFTETGVKQKKTLINSQPTTPYLHYWAVVTTPVWTLLTSFRFKTSAIAPQIPASGATSVYLSRCNDVVPLVSAGVELQQLRIPLQLSGPRVINLDFHADVIHEGQGADASIAVGFSFVLCYRSGATLAAMQAASFVPIKGALGGGNVSERNPQHYGNKSICTALRLGEGFHELSVIGNGHTDGSTTQGILRVLAEAGQGLNSLRATVFP